MLIRKVAIGVVATAGPRPVLLVVSSGDNCRVCARIIDGAALRSASAAPKRNRHRNESRMRQTREQRIAHALFPAQVFGAGRIDRASRRLASMLQLHVVLW